MFEPLAESDTNALSQGDLCCHVWFPEFVHNTAALVGSELQQPWDGVSMPKTFAVQPKRSSVLVLSQSCDLERLEDGTEGGILVCRVVEEEHSPILAAWRAAREEPENKYLELAAANPKQTKASSRLEGLEKQRTAALRKLWLGDHIGAFPVPEIGSDGDVLMTRAVALFDTAISLPSTPWKGVFHKQRVRRMTDPWRVLLQEALSAWLGRYAFPGSQEDRLAVGFPHSESPEEEPT